MKKVFFLIFTVCFLGACQHENDPGTPPPDLIPHDQMVKVIKEMHLLEAAISVRKTPGAVKTVFGDYDVFKKFGVTKLQYDNSITWYSKNLDEFKAIYAEAFDQLKSEQTILYKPKAAPAATGNTPPPPENGGKQLPKVGDKPGK